MFVDAEVGDETTDEGHQEAGDGFIVCLLQQTLSADRPDDSRHVAQHGHQEVDGCNKTRVTFIKYSL